MSGAVPAPSRTPDEVVAYLRARQDNGSVVDLDRMRLLAELLGRPDQAYPAVRVGGAGRGSVAAMVTALLGALGLKVGTFTVTHLQDVRERLRVAGEPVDADTFVQQLHELDPYVAEVDARSPVPVAHDELLTAIAFAGFADAPVDVGVFEATGPDDPVALARGHVAVVGATEVDSGGRVGGFAVEDGVVVSGRQAGAVEEVLTAAASGAGARLIRLGTDVDVVRRDLAVGGQMVTLRGVTGEVSDVYLPLHGRFQADNAALALAAVEGFLGFAGGIDPDVVRTGFAAVRLPGRLEVVRRTDSAPVVLDAAQTAAAAAGLAEAVRDEFAVRHRVVVLAPEQGGEVGDADMGGALLEVLAPVADHLVVVASAPDDAAGAPAAAALAEQAAQRGLTCEEAPDVAAALEAASGVATDEDLVLLTGSVRAVGVARDLLGLPVS